MPITPYRPLPTYGATDVAHFTYNHIENYLVVCNYDGPGVQYESTINIYRFCILIFVDRA